jgi:hypothetical protein
MTTTPDLSALFSHVTKAAGVDVDGGSVAERMAAHRVEAGWCSCGSAAPDALEHLGAVAQELLGVAPEVRKVQHPRRIGWREGSTNRIDELLDNEVPPARIAQKLGVPIWLVTRRLVERSFDHPREEAA